MNLRTRITLIACLGCSLLAVGLVVEGLIREHNVAQRLQQTRKDSLQHAWSGIVSTEVQRLSQEIPALNRNRRALEAMNLRDPTVFAEAIRPLLLRFQTSLMPTELVVVNLQGEVFFRTTPQSTQNLLQPTLIEAVVSRGGAVSGLFQRAPGDYVLATAFPLFSRVQPTGVAAFEVPVQLLLQRLANSTQAAFFLLDPDGRLAAATDIDLWSEVTRGDHQPGDEFPRKIFLSPRASADNPYPGMLETRVLALLDIPLPIALGPTSRLLAVEDVSSVFWQSTLASALGYGIAGISVVLFLAFLYWYLRRAFGPLNTVIQVLNNLATGDTNATLTLPPGSDEIGRLASTVEHFRQAQEARNQLQVIRQELEVATRIQSAIRPSKLPCQSTFRLHAQIHTAREVGGDFYDYFDLPDGRFAFTVADVSGKGIGAALFMAVARTVIRTTAMILPSPQDCLARTNDFLCLDNQESMFVTVFYGVLDPLSGILVYANAGHNPPYRLHTGGDIEALAPTGGIALGVMPDFEFAQTTIKLQAGEHLLLYTDGVTEAIDPEDQEFGNVRLEELLIGLNPVSPEELTQQVMKQVIAFADTAPQADDITLMALMLTSTPGS